MNKKNVLIIAVAAVAVVAVAAAVLLVNNNDSKDYSKVDIGEIGTYVPIFGNANNDLYIDHEDTKMLRYVIDKISKEGETGWDKTKVPFADANCDGVIDEKDIDLVNNIINKKSCKVYYKDYFGDVTEVSFPMVNRNIAVTYYQQAEACAILGVLDKVNVASKAATVYGTMWPSLKKAVEWGTTGSSAITDDAVEKFINNDVTIVVCTPRIENKDLGQRLHKERGIDFIQLWYNGNYCISTIQTMGILMNCQEKSEAYMKYCNNIAGELKSKISNKASKNLLVISGYDASNDKIAILANERHGSYVLIDKYLGNAYYEKGENQFGFVYRNVEWLVENGSKYDNIVFCMSGFSGYSDDQATGTYYSKEIYNTKFEDAVSYFSKVPAHKNGNIVGSVYPNTFGFSAYAILKVIAAQMYPDLFDLNDAMKTLQDWFDNYNVVDIDVTKNGPITYTGKKYQASYPQL